MARRIRPTNFRLLPQTRRTMALVENLLALLDALPTAGALPVDPLFLRGEYGDHVVVDRDGDLVGTIMQSTMDPRGGRWRWSLWSDKRTGRLPPHDGNAATLDDAKAAFRAAWERKKA